MGPFYLSGRDIYSYECLELNYIGLNAMLSLVYENR